MKVVILCGGKGTRLREETEYRPKPMVPIGGQPILWHIMKYYAHHGYKEFVLCLGYKGDMIKDYFRNYYWNTCDVTITLSSASQYQFHDQHTEQDWIVTLADTGPDTMTAARIKRIQRYIPKGQPFMLTYGDGLSNIDLTALIASHRQAAKVCTLSAVHPAGRFGSLKIEKTGNVDHFHEKPQMESAYVNGGYMICDYRMFDYLPEDPTIMLEQQPMLNLVRDGQLNAHKHEGWWQPMDTYQEMQYLNQLWEQNKAPWKCW
jgi:glucose-1-phosphate cytidylyltransferase